MPVVCTGNDFSTLYAPLIRDGRMEKFYWSPTRSDRVGVAMGIFQVSFLGIIVLVYLAIETSKQASLLTPCVVQL